MTLSDITSVPKTVRAEFHEAAYFPIKNKLFATKYSTGSIDQTTLNSNDKNNVLVDDVAEKLMQDAYANGYRDGQNAVLVEAEEVKLERDRLAIAIEVLHHVDGNLLSSHLWDALLSLFKEAVGNADIDKDFFQQRCREVIASIDTEIGCGYLEVSPSDKLLLPTLQEGLEVRINDDLLAGSVRLVQGASEISAGSSVIAQALEKKSVLSGTRNA